MQATHGQSEADAHEPTLVQVQPGRRGTNRANVWKMVIFVHFMLIPAIKLSFRLASTFLKRFYDRNCKPLFFRTSTQTYVGTGLTVGNNRTLLRKLAIALEVMVILADILYFRPTGTQIERSYDRNAKPFLVRAGTWTRWLNRADWSTTRAEWRKCGTRLL